MTSSRVRPQTKRRSADSNVDSFYALQSFLSVVDPVLKRLARRKNGKPFQKWIRDRFIHYKIGWKTKCDLPRIRTFWGNIKPSRGRQMYFVIFFKCLLSEKINKIKKNIKRIAVFHSFSQLTVFLCPFKFNLKNYVPSGLVLIGLRELKLSE